MGATDAHRNVSLVTTSRLPERCDSPKVQRRACAVDLHPVHDLFLRGRRAMSIFERVSYRYGRRDVWLPVATVALAGAIGLALGFGPWG